MRVALYARNSKPPKGWKPAYPSEEPPGSWKTQLAVLQKWAEREGHTVHMAEHDVVSGGDPNRPAWNRVLQAARGHHVHMIAVTKLDRVMRSVKHFLEVADELLTLGIDLTCLDQPGASVRKGDAMAKAFRGIAAVFAELELDLARERSAAVLERRPDGRLYGPRSDKPAGRPSEYGEGHKFRIRDGRRVHDAPRCPACRGEKGGSATPSTAPRQNA